MRYGWLAALCLGVLPACHPGLDASDSTTGARGGKATPFESGNLVDDPLSTSPSPTPAMRRLLPGESVLAADVDAIPAIFAREDFYIEAQAGDLEWDDVEPVVGLEIEGQARAYPVRLLRLHEVVNDVVGGKPVAVTCCPLCYSAVVFNRDLDRTLAFGVSGYLYANNLVMYDHQSNTLWSQMLAQGLKGAYRGHRLEVLPSELTTWGAWKAVHPFTTALSADRSGMQGEVVGLYVGYYTSGVPGAAGRVNKHQRLKGKELIVDVAIGDQVRAYPVRTVRIEGIIQDELGGLPLLLVFDEGLDTVVVYGGEIGGQTLIFEPASLGSIMVDAQTKSTWNLSNGQAIRGPLSGVQLTRLPAPLAFWFAWSDLHPDGDIFSD